MIESTDNSQKKLVDLKKLRNAINKSFSKSDLRDLCFDLEFDYENVQGDTKSEKVRELILIYVRNEEIHKLVTAFRKMRPNEDLEVVVLDELDENLLTQEKVPSGRKKSITTPILSQTNEKKVGFGTKSKPNMIVGGIIVALFIIGAIADGFGAWNGIKGLIRNIVEPAPVSNVPSEAITPTVSKDTIQTANSEQAAPNATATLIVTSEVQDNSNESLPTFNQGYTPTVMVKNGYEFVQVPAGTVIIGSDEIFVEEYWIGKYEVTNEQFVTFLNVLKSSNSCFNSRPCIDVYSENLQIYQDDGVWRTIQGYSQYPVVEVTYGGAREFCQKAIDNSDLPNSLQWTKAASWHPVTNEVANFPWGNDQPNQKLANYDKNNDGSLPVNSFELGHSVVGAFNMSGNVWEFIAVSSNSSQSIWMGGGWRSPSDSINVYASDNGSDISENDIGFRCAREE